MKKHYEWAIVLDFEATCERHARIHPQEIIEFPSVLLDLKTLKVVDEFEAFVRPIHRPELTDFCQELTGITQAEVDEAQTFEHVLQDHHAWLDHHELTEDNALMVTCGDWDLNAMFPAQIQLSDLAPMRPMYAEWLNIKELFQRVLMRRKPMGMMRMVRHVGIVPEGRHHRGIDDSRNITRLLTHLLVRGASFAPTKRLRPKRWRALVEA